MSWNEDDDANPYYNPEQCGLKKIAEVDYTDGCYQFDLRVVWRELATGKLYTARDSGCSCPCPFEDYRKLEDLDELVDITPLREEIHTELNSSCSYVTLDKGQAFLHKVRRALAKTEEA